MNTLSLIIILVIVIIIIAAIVFLYNELVKSRNRVKNAWAQIEVQLNRRVDLIPNLVETVKGYASHEKGVFDDVTRARSSLLGASTPQASAEANNYLTESLKSLFAVAEAYPELKASENFKNLQDQLAQTEDKISYARQFYNDTVYKYNNKCTTFPSNLMAKLFGFKEAEFFKAAPGAETVPTVEF